MPCHTFAMVSIHYLLSRSIFKPLEFQGQAIVLRKMAGQAAFILLFQGIGMQIVKKYYLWSFKIPKKCRGINCYDIGPYLTRISFTWQFFNLLSASSVNWNKSSRKKGLQPIVVVISASSWLILMNCCIAQGI